MSEIAFGAACEGLFDRERLRDRESAAEWAARIIDGIRTILGQIDLPPKDVVLEKVRTLLRIAFVKIDFPGPDLIIEPAIELLVLRIVETIYDRIASDK